MADDAGALLVRSGLVSSSALDDARARVEGLGGTLGEQLVATGAVTDDALTDFYKKRLLVPQVNPNTLARLPAKVVAVIPSTMAIELRAVPVSLDADNNLTIAMSDPSDRHAVDEIAAFTGSYVVRAVATQMQIAWCLAHYYGHVTHLGQRLLRAEEEANAADDVAATPAAGRPARTRGMTGEINASRKRAIVPGELEARSGELEARSGEIQAKPGVRDTLPELPVVDPDAPDDDDADDEPIEPPEPAKPRQRSVSGEIRVPGRRAPSIKPPLPEDSGQIGVPDIDSGPVISIEPAAPVEPSVVDPSGPVVVTMEMEAEDAGDYEPEVIEIQPPSEDPTDRTRLPVPKRKRPAEPDPPELAARAGEVQFATGAPIKEISFDEPRIIISDELVDEPRGNASGAVSGEVRSRPAVADELPAQTESIFVELGGEADDDENIPAIIHDARVDESQPVLLDRPRAVSAPPVAHTIALEDAPTNISDAPVIVEDEPSDVVVLDARKAPAGAGPRHRNTVVGIGAVTATTQARLFDTAASSTGVPSEDLDDQPTGARTAPHLDNDPTRVDAYAAPAREDDTSDELLAAPPSPYEGRDTSQIAAVPSPSKAVPGPSGQIRLDNVKRAPSRHDDEEDDDALDEVTKGKPTMVMSAIELDDVIPGRTSQVIPGHLVQSARSGDLARSGEIGGNNPTGKKVDYDPVDDGWGPPGTTIPPPLLGAIPGSDLSASSGVIPIPDMDSAPLIVAPPVPPQAGRTPTPSDAGISRALEQATARVLELIHTLDHTTERDQVVAVMIAHLAETHQRAGFFAARGGVLTLFAITPRVPSMPNAALRLDRPSTLQDVVGTRLPYRGPMLDEASRSFLTATLGACPTEILLVPVSVRERVVGVLFGDNRTKHTFDDQLALAARAAGMAFERILNAKRGDA